MAALYFGVASAEEASPCPGAVILASRYTWFANEVWNKVPTMRVSERVDCHRTLDPVAGLFQDCWRFDRNFAIYGNAKRVGSQTCLLRALRAKTCRSPVSVHDQETREVIAPLEPGVTAVMRTHRYSDYAFFRLLGVVVLVSFLPSKSVVGEATQDESGTPQEQYTATLKDYSLVGRGLRDARTDLERKQAVVRMSECSSRFVELAAKYPQDRTALSALQQAIQIVASTDSAALQTWEINSSQFVSGNTAGSTARVIELVLRDHLHSQQLGPILDRMRYGYRLEFAACLRTVLKENPHYEVQGLACLALAQFLHDKLRMLQLVEDRPELIECYEIVFGSDYLPALQRLGRADLSMQIEALLERASREYSDVKFWNTTVGETAKSELYEIRFLSVGKVAPDIKGRDQNGRPLILRDYRGQVVLLYFWSEY